MEGFVNNTKFSTFENGLMYSKRYANYGYDKTSDTKRRENIQQNTSKPQINLQSSYGLNQDLLGLSLPENLDDAALRVLKEKTNEIGRASCRERV